MARIIATPEDVAEGVAALIAADARLAAVHRLTGQPPLRRSEPGFATLAEIVVAQQVSTASARAIWQRCRLVFDPFEPGTLLAAPEERYRAAGLSGPKIRTLRALAAALAGGLDLDALAGLTADEAHAALTRVPGIGPWTADVYLLFGLGHADAFAAGDLAVREAARVAFGLEARPQVPALLALAEAWRPWRGVAARLLWAYYPLVKGRRDGQGLPLGDDT
jgi:DNA-3-methyladenine glycosylase II